MYDIIIIGAGPTGASAGIFTSKAGKKTLILNNEKSSTKRALIFNHYGLDEVTGPNLVDIGIKQAVSFGAEVINEQANIVENTGDTVKVTTENHTYEANYVIVATGYIAKLAEESNLEVVEGHEPFIKKIIHVDKEGRTNIKGIWAAGPVAGTSAHTIIAAGDGAKVAVNILSEIEGKRFVDHDALK